MSSSLRRFCRIFRPLALSVLLAGTPAIQAGDPEDAREILLNESAWIFIDGAEFPGATGSVSGEELDGREMIVANYDFTGGGNYVEIETKETVPEGFAELRFEARSDRYQSIVVRLVDSTDQTHQYSLKYTSPSEWQNLRVELSEQATDHYHGADDGVLHYPIKAIGFCILAGDANRAEAGKVEFSKPQLVK